MFSLHVRDKRIGSNGMALKDDHRKGCSRCLFTGLGFPCSFGIVCGFN